MMTRWRRPPESSKGNWSSRSAGWGISTISRTSRARLRASSTLTPSWIRTPSPICWPIFVVGLSELIGSWGIRATVRPRWLCISFSRQRREIDAVEDDVARRDLPVARQQAHDRQAGGRLAAARFADEAHALALGDL